MNHSKRIRCELNTDSIAKTIKYLQDYRNSFHQKNELFISRLADEGIMVARTRLTTLDDMGSAGLLVHFDKKIYPELDKCKGVLEMSDSMEVMRFWLGVDNSGNQVIKSAKISPVLMYEFGSGAYATSEHATDFNAKVPVGKGTFPSNLNKPNGNPNHAVSSSYWNYKALDGTWHRTSGIKPTQPLYNAWLNMRDKMVQIAKEVYGQ